MRAETAGGPEALYLWRLAQNKLAIGCEGLKPVDALRQFNMFQNWNALNAALHQALKTGRVEWVNGRIIAIRNGIHMEGYRVAFIAADNQSFAILPKIDQFIRVAQVGNNRISGEFG